MQTPATERHTAPSVCPLDCADTCSLSIDVAGDRIERVRGSDANPFTRGKICAKVAQGLPELVQGPRRLTQPMLRTGPRGSGAFEEISWEQALDVVYQRFSHIIDQHGAQAIAPLQIRHPCAVQ